MKKARFVLPARPFTLPRNVVSVLGIPGTRLVKNIFMNNLQTPIWQLSRLLFSTSRAGFLTLADGFLSFETEEGPQLRCHVSQMRDVKWPWYSFGCGLLNFSVDGAKYRFSFARPNGAAAAWRPVSAISNVWDLGRATKTGKAWKQELAQQTGK